MVLPFKVPVCLCNGVRHFQGFYFHFLLLPVFSSFYQFFHFISRISYLPLDICQYLQNPSLVNQHMFLCYAISAASGLPLAILVRVVMGTVHLLLGDDLFKIEISIDD